MNLVSLQLITTNDFENNLSVLVSLIEKTNQNPFIVAPELA